MGPSPRVRLVARIKADGNRKTWQVYMVGRPGGHVNEPEYPQPVNLHAFFFGTDRPEFYGD